MKQNFKKLLSIFLSLTMVLSSAIYYEVKADMTTEQMVASAQYNVALGKVTVVAPSMQEGNVNCLTDGVFTPGGEHAATTFGTPGTYYQIDLGAVYDISTLDQLVVGYKENNDGDIPAKGYKVQISGNGLDFTTVKEISGSVVKDACTNNNLIEVDSLEGAEGAARYIRLFYPDSYTWGIQVTEIAVLDIDGNAATMEVEKCDDAAGVTVTSPDYNTITYTIVPGENQEGYKYIVYLDGTKQIGNGVNASEEYTITGVEAGLHTIKVIAAYDGKASDGITSEGVVVNDISGLVSSKKNVTNKRNNSLVEVSSVSSFYNDHTLSTAQNLVDGSLVTGEGNDKCLRTGAGSPQEIVVDLGDYYTPGEFEKALIAYTNNRTYASDTKIAFSLDGIEFTEVAAATNYVFNGENDKIALNQIKLDKIADYTKEAVRFVKITLSNGASGWGYVVNEFSLIANTEEPTIVGSDIPEAADVVVDASELEKIKYTIVAGEGQENSTYVVKFAGQTINEEAKAGETYVYEGIEAGTYEIKVSTLENGWLSKGINKSVDVDGYINYIAHSLNLAYKDKHGDVVATCDNDNKDENYLTGSQEISAGVWALNNGVYTDFGHHTGYLQTRPDNDEANIIYDLGKEYNKNDIYSVISMYEGSGNAATEYEIYFSATGEDETYEKVFYVKDAKFKKFMNDRVDVSEYTQDSVRFVKYHIITGNYARHYKDGNPQNTDPSNINWGSDGYHLCELAVMGKESLLPEAPANVSVTSPEFDTIVVKWDDVENQEVLYNIYIDGNKLAENLEAGINEKTFTINAGTHQVYVESVLDGMGRSSQVFTVNVETETTQPPSTTQPPTTTKPIVVTDPTTKVTPTVPQNPTTKNNIRVSRPAKSKITKVIVGKKKISVKFKKVKGAKGYVVQYSLKKNFKKAKTVQIKKLKATVKKLKKGKRYYIRVRAYKLSGKKKVYGTYCKAVRSKKVK